MTSKTSFFSMAIYKSLLKRYKWGSILYFAILFLTSVRPVVSDLQYYWIYSGSNVVYMDTGSMLSNALLVAMGVAVVVGLLVFRFMHSKKEGVFIHSMPIKRTTVYISALAGAFTLMAIPVVVTGIILVILSLTSYSHILSAGACFVWVGINLLCLFVMFSCSCFIAMLTGNSFAYVGLNIVFHIAPSIIALCFGVIAENFLYGYVPHNTVVDSVMDSSVFAWMMNMVSDPAISSVFDLITCAKFVGVSVLLYVVAGVLYKKRNIETVGDVAGFKCLNVVFKYLLTFISATVMLVIFGNMLAYNIVAFIIIYFIVCGITYFASEMILKKSVRIWKKASLGFGVFTLLFGICVYNIAFTSFFGYETYVPDKDDVAMICTDYYYYDYIDDYDVISKYIELHKEACADAPVYKKVSYSPFDFHVVYRMKDGREIKRTYDMDSDEMNNVVKELYEVESYKADKEPPLGIDEKYIHYVVYKSADNQEWIVIDGKEFQELNKCVKEDLKSLSFDQIYSSSSGDTLEYVYTDIHVNSVIYTLNSNFVRTNKWLSDNKSRLHGQYYLGPYEIDSYADFFIVDNEVMARLQETYSNAGIVGLAFENFRYDKYIFEGEASEEFTADTLENEHVLYAKDENADKVFNYLYYADNSINPNGELYIFGKTAVGNYVIVESITTEELEEFKQAVLE